MPLLDLDRPLYVRRDRHYVDSDQRSPASRDEFDIITTLPKRFENVQSIEVVNYNIPADIGVTFFAKTNSSRGNNLLDVRLTTDAVAPPVPFREIYFTVVIPAPVSIKTTSELRSFIEDVFTEQLDAQGDPYFNTANGFFFEFYDAYSTGVFEYTCRNSLRGDETQPMYFLFGTGPNKENGPARILGFDEGTDTIFPLDSPLSLLPFPDRVVVAYHQVVLSEFVYADVFIKEMETSLLTNTPSARIFLAGPTFFNSSSWLPWRPRLMTSPLQRADTLQIRLEFENRIRPLKTLATDGWDITLDFLMLSNEPSVPLWIKSRFDHP